MGKIIFGIFILSLVGCKNFETKKVSSEEILQRQLEHFSWSEVDTYPSFDACKAFVKGPDLKKCFENILTQHIYTEIGTHVLASSDSINETLRLYLVISDQGTPRIDSLGMSAKLRKQIPLLKNWIDQGLESLPKIYPARTRGIPVATKFILPIKVISE